MFSTILRFRYVAFMLALTIGLVSLYLGRHLPINLDLIDLLPENNRNVVEMKQIEEEVGGAGYLVVIVGPSKNPLPALSLIENALKNHPLIYFVFYQKEKFLLKDKLLYLLSPEDFNVMTKHAHNLFFSSQTPQRWYDLGIETPEEKTEAEEYFSQFEPDLEQDQYFTSVDGDYTMLLIKPKFDSNNLEKSQQLLNDVRKELNSVLAEKYPYQFTGRYFDKTENVKQIKGDIRNAGVMAFLTICVLLFLGLGTLWGAFATTFIVGIALGWTAGIGYLLVGQVNILTSFLIGILGGLGVEYGIHLIKRYYQEIKDGFSKEAALEKAYIQTSRVLFSAAITSSGSFLILSLSDVRLFSEVGLFAGFGILSIYFSFILCFPFCGQFLGNRPRFSKITEGFGFYPITLKWRWSALLVCIAILFGTLNTKFEYDFQKLFLFSNKAKNLKAMGNELFGKSMVPSALLAKDEQQALEVKAFLEKEVSEVDQAISLYSVLPLDMKERREKLNLLESAASQNLQSLEQNKLDTEKIKSLLKEETYSREDLPIQLRSIFGNSGNIVYAYPKNSMDHASTIRSFSNVLLKARDKFPGLKVGSDSIVFIEILDKIINDGMIILLIFLLTAFFVFWLDFRNIRSALILELQLVFGIICVIGLMGLLGEPFTIFNLGMVPAVLAAGIDIGVHVRHRERESYQSSIASARFVAQGVQLSVLTTMVGFGSLFVAQGLILQGVAWVSVLGQLSMFLICMVISPIIRDSWKSYKSSKYDKNHIDSDV